MHIKLLYRKVLYVFLSLAIVIAPTIQQANAASSWSITGAVSAGSRSVVSASKAGYKSAVNIAPTAGRLALKLGKGANWAALVYAAIQLAPDLADIDSFQPEYPNDRVRYEIPIPAVGKRYQSSDGVLHITADAAAQSNCSIAGLGRVEGSIESLSKLIVSCSDGRADGLVIFPQDATTKYEYISIPAAAAQMIKNANAGHALSQAATRETATEMVIGGQFDQDLLSGAVPTNETRPLVPSVPISGNGNVTHGGFDSTAGNGTGIEGGMTGGDMAQATSDAIKAAEDAKTSSDAAKDAVKAAEDKARELSDAASDLINGNEATEAAIEQAKSAAAEAVKAAELAKAVAEAAAKSAAEAARAAEAATAQAVKNAAAAATKSAADLAAAIAAGDAASATAATAAKAAADAALAAAKEAAAAAQKAADRAKAEAAKPFELPAFCTWAAVVCDYTVWVKEEYGSMSRWLKEEPTATPAELMPIDDDPSGLGNIFQDKAEAGYVSFESSCPADVLIPIDLMGASQVLNISYTPFCHFASMIRYAVILGAWISGLLIVTGGRSRE